MPIERVLRSDSRYWPRSLTPGCLALEELERGTAARGAVRHLVLRLVLLARGRGVAATDHRHRALARHVHDLVHHLRGALGEAVHLENPHRAVPDERLGLLDRLRELLAALRADLPTRPPLNT